MMDVIPPPSIPPPPLPRCRLARLEHLMERRPELLSSVMLRQNPHNVHEWHKRAKLFASNPAKQILTYTEAVKTVDADKVRQHGRASVSSLWGSFWFGVRVRVHAA
jgi:hypothetical protein